MFKTLLQHAWLSFRRAHYFERSLAIKAIIGFTIIVVALHLYTLARILPGLLTRFFPDTLPHETFFSFLIILYISDLMIRFFGQGIPRHRIAPYLHLPVSRNNLSGFILARTWLSPYNYYLLVLHIPFFRLLIPHNYSMGAYWNIIIGMFLLAALNNALTVYSKTSFTKGPGRWIIIPPLVIAGSAAMSLYPIEMMNISKGLGNAFMQGHWAAFAIPLLLIVMLQYLSLKAISKSSYPEISARTRAVGSESIIGRWLAKVPFAGPYWNLEWKLLTRNKRARNNFYQWPLVIPVLILAFYFLMDPANIASWYVALLMISGSYGFYHLQYVFSWESHFFDFIATRNVDLKRFILAKYLFYVAMATLQFLIILPFLFFRPGMPFMFMSLWLYACGPVFAMLIYLGVSNSTRLDPNKRAYFNFEGTSGSLFITVLLVMATLIPMGIMGFILPWGIRVSIFISTSVTGAVFIALFPWWINATVKKFEKLKYRKLEKFREE